ncbi:hypothetical protein D8674_009496 [Pyrus ussuriensis x Pyrus communis]|uniref:ABC transporter domain-containing protein n=1 Tax=Pyrus ussuriensis x Pyrus communis TaxID=2448454 RepID=A0A5N5F857_9ROSA|nr:hypothetical protein D8674_009496 [Pyrus ussuriensis x Pyrus communis]
MSEELLSPNSPFHVDKIKIIEEDEEVGLQWAVDNKEITEQDEEVQLQWAAIERLPTVKRIGSSIFDVDAETDNAASNIGKEYVAGKRVVDVTKFGADERHLFIEKLTKHIENDDLRLLQKLRKRMDRALSQSLFNRSSHITIEAVFTKVIWCKSPEAKISILTDVCGVVKSSRLTLLLGPPGCGKTTFLFALAGKLDKSFKVSGEISYNGYKLDEFVPQKTSAYISQHDLHLHEMTVRETIDFSARCQGVGSRAAQQKGKRTGIVPDPDIDTYMKAISVEGQSENPQTDYVLKVNFSPTNAWTGYVCDTMVGDALRRGISGGQKKRLTTREMIVGPTKALFMDEISTGLDSSTTFQIVTYLQQLVHITDTTALGKIVYHGPCSQAVKFFEDCGFKCPPRKGAADFLQEHDNIPYGYVSTNKFFELFRASYLGKKLDDELSEPYNKSQCHDNALSFSTYSVSNWELFKACMARELLLMKRNSFLYVFKTAQLVITAFITMAICISTLRTSDLINASFLLNSLFDTLIRLMTNGVAELSLTVTRLPVVYKQRGFNLYPAWEYSLPASILKVPFSVTDSLLWTAITYYLIGYAPDIKEYAMVFRFFYQFLVLFALHQASTSICRLIPVVFQTMVVASTCGILILVLMFLSGSFILPRSSLPPWLRWLFWCSPMTYGEIGTTLNEFLAPHWQKVSEGNTTLGNKVLTRHGLNFDGYLYWISVGALLGFTMLSDVGFILALTYLDPPKVSRAIVSKKRVFQLRRREARKTGARLENESTLSDLFKTMGENITLGSMVLPFEPLTISFKDVQYYVDTPPEMRQHAFKEKKLQLLKDITGAFRPGILTALIGVTGAGKTTLMDVPSGRKTGGSIVGDIRIGGYPKVQKTLTRISGYCEQTDIHSPQITVEESLMFSAWLLVPHETDPDIKAKFVEEVIQTIELEDIRDSLVGIPGQTGLSTKQRKGLTIAVELVSNPSIICMDEPTSGLDARAAAIVMRVVKNVVSTGRTTVCTIHQPSIDIFESFDEDICDVPKIKENYNPATWMLEVRDAVELVSRLSKPKPGSRGLNFPTPFAQNSWVQFKACLWKQHLSYWRSPKYNLARFAFIFAASVLFGTIFWQKGKEINNEQDLFNVLGLLYVAVIFLGTTNCSTVLPYVATERAVLYRERFAGMYSSNAYSFAQVAIEIPYIVVQAILYVIITYPTIGYHWSATTVFWYFHATFSTFLYFVYLGMLIASFSTSLQVASSFATAIYTILNLFSGFHVPGPEIPKWWICFYWICPTSWSLNALLSSQYGDMNKEIFIFGEQKTVASFLQDYYGFHHDRLFLVVIVLIAFPIVFASLFAFSVRKLNFHR